LISRGAATGVGATRAKKLSGSAEYEFWKGKWTVMEVKIGGERLMAKA
jgi:hypothetical protein